MVGKWSQGDRVYGRKTVAVVLLNRSFTGRMLSDFGRPACISDVQCMQGALGVETRQSLGESGGWYAKETPGGGAGGFGTVATAWPELPEAIKAASWRWSRPPRGARNSRGLTGEIGASPPVAAGPFQHFPPKSGRARPRSAGVDEHAWGHLTRVPRALLRQRQSHPAVVLPAGSETGSGDDLLMVLCLRESSTS